MDERGTVIRSRSAHDPAISDSRLDPYSVLPVPTIDRAVLTTTDMDSGNKEATSQWVQFWRLSDLSLLKSVALPPGPRGDEHYFTGEPKLLPDGQSVYVHTFNCGLHLIRGVDRPEPTVSFVKGLPGKDCGVPVLTSHYWLQADLRADGEERLDDQRRVASRHRICYDNGRIRRCSLRSRRLEAGAWWRSTRL